jgi:hypothetical protein
MKLNEEEEEEKKNVSDGMKNEQRDLPFSFFSAKAKRLANM